MEETYSMLRLKSLFLILFFSLNLDAIEVVITTSKINYKDSISISKIAQSDVQKIKKYCIPMKLSDFKVKKYTAKRYLKKGTVICAKDVESLSENSVLFNFGSIQIEKPGKVIFENDKFIKIKKRDGKIEKIYKDGRLQ